MKRTFTPTILFTACCLMAACNSNEAGQDASPVSLPRTEAPQGASVYIVAPEDGAEVTSPVRVEFGARNVEIVPAGDQTPASGHHHLVINAALPDEGAPIPASEQYIHFGDGATSTELELPPGEHTLRLVLGDYLHIPHDPPIVSPTIRITVVD